MNIRNALSCLLLSLVLLQPLLALGAGRDHLSYNETVSGTIATAGETHTHTFTAQAGDIILVRMAEQTAALEPSILLTGPLGQLYSVYDYTTAEIVTDPVAATGEYSLTLRDHNSDDTGDFVCHLQCLNRPAGATPLAPGQTMAAPVDQPAKTVAFALDLAGGDEVILRLAEDAGTPSLNPELRLYRPDGSFLTGDLGGSTAELNTVSIPATGTYLLLALDYAGTTMGDAWVHLQRTDDPAGAVALSYGQTLAGTLTRRSETVAYRFTATAGDVLLARLAEGVNVLEPMVRLYGPDGTQLAGIHDYTLAEMPVTTLASGTHTLLVMDSPGLDVGGFHLHIQRLNDPAGAPSLSYGETPAGSLDQPAATVAYNLTGAAGDRLLLRLAEDGATPALNPALRIYRTDGTLLAEHLGGSTAEINTLELPATDTYTVVALDYAGTTWGDYHIHAQNTADPAGAGPIVYGQTLAGTLTWRSEAVAYRFTATAGDVLLARLAEGVHLLEPMVRLYGPDGTQLAGIHDYTLAELELTALPVSGQYTLLAMDNPGLDVGGFHLHIQRINGPAGAEALPAGTTAGGTLDQPAATRAYWLTGEADQHFLLRLAEDQETSALNPALRLYAPDGTLVAGDLGGSTAEINTVALPAGGTYTLLALDYAGTTHGSYWLYGQCTTLPANPVVLSYGDTTSGTLSLRAQGETYTFAAAVGDTVLIRMAEITSALEPLVRLYDPAGEMLAGIHDYTTAELSGLSLAMAGTYTIVALDSPGLDTGAYTLSLNGGSGGPSPVPDPDLLITELALRGGWPNPFNPRTAIWFDLPAAGRVRLDIHALNGRRLATLLDEQRTAGRQSATWDGRDAAGRRVASGTYLVLLQAAGERRVGRVTMVK